MITTRITTRKTLACLMLTAAVATPVLADYAYTPGYGYSASVNYAQPAYPQPAYAQPTYAQPVATVPAVPTLNSAQIDQLTASVALYPDPLLAQVLTAASAQQDIAAAADYQQRYPNVDDYTLSLLPWDPSVKNLMHYPTVLQTLAQYPQWSANLGTAFTYQQADVLNSIQRWRIQAQLAGTLIPTPQQQVIVEPSYIQIQPVTQVIYVPRYDPCTVYLPQRNYASNAVAFGYAGSGFAFNLEFDWNNHKVQGSHHDNGSHYGNDGQHHGNDGPRYSNDGPRNDGPRGNDNRNDSRPTIVQQQPPQGQRIVNAVPAAAPQRDPQPRVTDPHPAAPRDSLRAIPQPVVQPVAKQPAPKNAGPQRDEARPAQAAPQVVAKQQTAPKTAAQQHKEDQERKLLALSRL